MYKWALAGLLMAAICALLFAGPLAMWVEQFGPIAVLVVALVYRLAVVALVVWLGMAFFDRHRERHSRL